MKLTPAIVCPARMSYAPRIIALGVLVLLLKGALLRSCAQTANQPASHPAGVYTLVSVAGKPVPCIIKHEGSAMTVESGSFTITTNGQITSVMMISVGERKDLRIERHATYTMKNSEFTMKWQNAGTTKGHLAGQTFTMTNEGKAYVYQK